MRDVHGSPKDRRGGDSFADDSDDDSFGLDSYDDSEEGVPAYDAAVEPGGFDLHDAFDGYHDPAPDGDEASDSRSDAGPDASTEASFEGPGFENASEKHEFVAEFMLANPAHTVTVSALPDGRVSRVRLETPVARWPENRLAAEIVVVARLATDRARAAQYASLLEGMSALGHDEAATREFLTRDLDLPSPEDVVAAEARVFTGRYAGDHD